jgi:hypothetical protein
MKMKFMLLLCVIISNLHLSAQNINYFGLFPTIDHGGKLSNRWSYNVYLFDAIKPYTSTENSFRDESRSFYIYGEGGISYQLTPKLSITGAYVFERQNPFKDYWRNEHRAFQQLTYKTQVGKGEGKLRLRFDERFKRLFFEDKASFSHRARALAGYKRKILNDKYYLMMYSEFFFNTTEGSSNFFEENWSACQLGIPINDWSSLEVGPLYVGWINNAQKDWLHQFYLQITWATSLDFSKKG